MTTQNLLTRALLKARHYHRALGVKGVLLFAWSKLSRTHPIHHVAVQGIVHSVALRIGTTDVSVFRQVLQECQYDVALPFRPASIVDAGANIGLASVFFANKYPSAEIIAIEPDESNFKVLVMNVQKYRNITPIKGALANHHGEVKLVDVGMGHHGFRTLPTSEPARVASTNVPAYTVDQLMQRMNWNRIDLFKIDIEGAEKEVLDMCGSWIQNVGSFMIELHDSIQPGCGVAFEKATIEFEGRAVRGESVIAWRR
jgi:FkbM family methyltransferase